MKLRGSKYSDEEYRFPSSIGAKIKKYRELRGLTQQELGIRCGFAKSSASVRINQYENDKKIPQEAIIKSIADALSVNEFAFYNDDFIQHANIFHALFDIEDFYGFYPAKCEDGYCLMMGSPLEPTYIYNDINITRFMEEWCEARNKYSTNSNDSSDQKKEKRSGYALWRAGYPDNVKREQAELELEQRRLEKLQNEMDELNARLHGNDELDKLDKAMNPFYQKASAESETFTRASDFAYMVLSLLKKGVKLKIDLDDAQTGHDTKETILIGADTEDLLEDVSKLESYACLAYQFDSLSRYGIIVRRDIASLNKRFYIVHMIDRSQYKYFKKIHEYWEQLTFYAEKEASWSGEDLEYHKKMLEAMLVLEHDVVFEDIDKKQE